MNVSVGIVERRDRIVVELIGAAFVDENGRTHDVGAHELRAPITLTPVDPASASFAIPDVTIGIGFHWERDERQVFRGALRVVTGERGLTAVNDVSVEDYVLSVISSEMSASCPLELLKAHAVISRSWLLHPLGQRENPPAGNVDRRAPGRVTRWYGREAHQRFDVCADDHCQRYQGITKAFTPAAAEAVAATAREALVYERSICDARFSKCCGGMTEAYRAAWDDRDVPYLVPLYDGPAPAPAFEAEAWIRGDPPAYCNTSDRALLARLLPGFDQETLDFYRWTVRLTGAAIRGFVQSKIAVDLGAVLDLRPLERGASGRIVALEIVGAKESLVVAKELEIRRALSPSHLYSSAFVVSREGEGFLLRGAGWGHGVGLCQIGAAVMASQGHGYREILAHYYPGANVRALDG